MKLVQVASALAFGAVVLAALPAEAQSSRTSTNWRKRDRAAARTHGSPQNFAFELRFGPYYPAVDDEFGGDGPYKKFFGDEWRFHFGAEFDWQAARIPWVGTIGPGIGIGYTSATGFGFKDGVLATSDTTDDARATQETSLTIIPMHISAVLRADELLRRTGFPLVPYAKLGFGWGFWWVDAGDKTAEATLSNGSKLTGEGTSFGVHWGLGAALALDFLGRREMAAVDQDTGVNHMYIFAEWMNQNLGLGSNQMNVGTSTWMTGLTLEM